MKQKIAWLEPRAWAKAVDLRVGASAQLEVSWCCFGAGQEVLLRSVPSS